MQRFWIICVFLLEEKQLIWKCILLLFWDISRAKGSSSLINIFLPLLLFSHMCMKCSLGISNFLQEIASLSHSIVFLYFFALITGEGFLISLCFSLVSAFSWLYLSYSPLSLACLFSPICKASSDNLFAVLFLRDCLDHCLLYNVTNLCPWFFRHSVYQI